MDWRTIPGFMPQAIPTMQQAAYSAPPHTGGWTTTTHAGAIAFQQPVNVSLQSQTVNYSNGFGGGQQFKKAVVPQFGRPIHTAYAQGPMPIVHRKSGNSLLSVHEPTASHNDVEQIHSMSKNDNHEIIEVWDSKNRPFTSNIGAPHGAPWIQGPGRVTIKSEPVDSVEGNPWETAKSVPAFPTNLPNPGDNASWHPVSDVSPVPLAATSSHYTMGYTPQDPTRGNCLKKDAPSLPINVPYNPNTVGINHNMPNSSNGGKPAGMPVNATEPNQNIPQGPETLPKKKKEKKGPPIPCKQCGKEFSKSYMKKHIRSHAEMKPYVCSTCSKVFYSAALLAEHEGAFHDEEKKHQCYVCGHRFHQKSLLKEHLKSHVEKPYKCRVCPRSFSRRIKLNNHEKLHEGAQLKQCDICGKLLKGRVSLKCHMHNMHSDARKKFPCLDCGRIFLLERIGLSNINGHRYMCCQAGHYVLGSEDSQTLINIIILSYEHTPKLSRKQLRREGEHRGALRISHRPFHRDRRLSEARCRWMTLRLANLASIHVNPCVNATKVYLNLAGRHADCMRPIYNWHWQTDAD
ncbi:Zinc finger and SCAN domain-containing protein 5B [Chamberlinius hualienensis]